MARARLIHKRLASDREWVRLSEIGGDLTEFCQSIYPFLVVHADDYGRLQADACHVKFAMCPTSRRTLEEFDRALDLMADAGLIARYEASGAEYAQVMHFGRDQPLARRTPSKLPGLQDSGVIQRIRSNAGEYKGTQENPGESGASTEKAGKTVPNSDRRYEGSELGTIELGTVEPGTKNAPPTPPAGDDQPAKAAKPRTKTEPQRLMDLFDERHREHLGAPAPPIQRQDAKFLTDLHKRYGYDTCASMIREFFQLDDPWVEDKGYGINIFRGQIGKLLTRLRSRDGPGRGDASDEAFERVVAGRGVLR